MEWLEHALDGWNQTLLFPYKSYSVTIETTAMDNEIQLQAQLSEARVKFYIHKWLTLRERLRRGFFFLMDRLELESPLLSFWKFD